MTGREVFYPDFVDFDARTNSMDDAVQLQPGPGYVVKRAAHAWGTPRTVTAIRAAGISQMRVVRPMLIAAIVLAIFLRRPGSALYGLNYGFHVGLFFVATMTGVHYLFERRSLKRHSAGRSAVMM